MPQAALLLREDSSLSLSTLVEKSQQKEPPHPLYDLQLAQSHLEIIEKTRIDYKSTHSQDEGFESDVDSVSIVSSDGSFEAKTLAIETDSANGSASSDSDTEASPKTHEQPSPVNKESHDLVDCVCYSDVKVPDVLLFVIKQEALVFKFDSLKELRDFYLNFTALKAVTNQQAYTKNSSAKFNLLQRTDRNGVTHIEITREPDANFTKPKVTDRITTNIISLNTPEYVNHNSKSDVNSRQRSEAIFVGYQTLGNTRRSSNDNILHLVSRHGDSNNVSLRKVWNSAEDLLDLGPKRPERRKKVKGRAPPPPTKSDVMSGEYVRVNVNNVDSDFIAKSQGMRSKPPPKPLMVTLLRPNRVDNNNNNGGNHEKRNNNPSWTNSVPRLLLKQRSKSETRNFTPMAYRYIDTTPNYVTSSQMGNRLFGLSPKLRDFPPRSADSKVTSHETRWGSLGELTYKKCDSSSNLKSVIKNKEDCKKKNDKKVTFSAYTTVQVV